MRAFETTFDIVLYRFFLMMGVIIASFVLNVPFLALLAVPIFLSALLGLKFELPRKQASETTVKKLVSKRTAA